MKNSKIIPVILAGGAGTRLWPVSREDVPKQFCALNAGLSLFQETVIRVSDDSLFLPPVIVTGERYAEMALRQMDDVSCKPDAIICEPEGKDTAAAVLLAAEVSEFEDDALMLVLPSDHRMGDEEAFYEAVRDAAAAIAEDDRIVTFGIEPSSPETGFGYLRAGGPLAGRRVRELEEFVEKPELSLAKQLIRDPGVFWNAGILLFRPLTMLAEAGRYAPRIALGVRQSVYSGSRRESLFFPDAESFSGIPAISLDYAIMEKTDKAAMRPVDPQWSDLGSWRAIWEISDRSHSGNVVGERCFAAETENCLVRSDGPAVGVSGVNDVVVVASKDAVLVTSRENPQGVKKLVESMKDSGIAAASAHPGEDRPWGRFDSLDRGEKHQVKRIRVDPGQRLSLQYHHHRAEHWVVIKGTATVTVDKIIKDLKAGEQVYIPQGAVHRLDNFTDSQVEIIEVQIGTYFGEDDIVRLEDVYGRKPVPGETGSEAA